MILSGINSSNTKAGKAEPKQQTANHFHRDEGDTGDTDKAKKLENHIEQQIWCHKVLSHVSPSSLQYIVFEVFIAFLLTFCYVVFIRKVSRGGGLELSRSPS
jgi:hypothetical protein